MRDCSSSATSAVQNPGCRNEMLEIAEGLDPEQALSGKQAAYTKDVDAMHETISVHPIRIERAIMNAAPLKQHADTRQN
jgi:hypothetical protein